MACVAFLSRPFPCLGLVSPGGVVRMADCWPLSDGLGLVLSFEALEDRGALLFSLSSASTLWRPCWKA